MSRYPSAEAQQWLKERNIEQVKVDLARLLYQKINRLSADEVRSLGAEIILLFKKYLGNGESEALLLLTHFADAYDCECTGEGVDFKVCRACLARQFFIERSKKFELPKIKERVKE